MTREYESRNAVSYLVAPLLDGGPVKAALTLARRRESPHGRFAHTDQEMLDGLGMDRVVRRVHEAFDMRSKVIGKEIVALFTPQADPVVLAQQLVEKLCKRFEWEYVGLFRVNRARQVFEVAAEYDAHGDLKFLPSFVKQSLDAGMLGNTLKAGHALYVPDVTKKGDNYDYIRISENHASALTFPIKIGPHPDAQIEWILDLESSQFHAFPYPERENLERTILEVERAVALWFEARLARSLLNVVEQGVVVLGNGARIERVNEAARRLLGLPKDSESPVDAARHVDGTEAPDALFGDFLTFAGDETTRKFITGEETSSNGIHLRLKGADHIERRVLAVASYQDEAFHRRVLLLADVDKVEWTGALKYMETAVRTVAAQAHGRLLLAGTLLRSAERKISADSPVRGLIDRAARNVSAADLPYERIASVFDVMSAPRVRDGFLDLAGELRRFKNALPQEEAEDIQLEYGDDLTVIVNGDPERLAFAFRSLIGHLLSVRSTDDPLTVSINLLRKRAFVRIVLTANDSASVTAGLAQESGDAPIGQQDQVAHIESLAFSVASHAIDAIRKVIRKHGGKLTIERQASLVVVSMGGMPVAAPPIRARDPAKRRPPSNEERS